MAANMANLPEFTGVGDTQTTVHEVSQSNVDFFDGVKPVPEVIIGRHTQFIPTSTDIDYDYGPVQFEIKNAGQHYLDFSTVRLKGKFQVLKADGAKMIGADDVAIINNFPHALWDSIDVTVDGVLQTELTTSRYGYKAYIEQLLSYNQQSEGHMKPLSLWHMDTPGKYEVAKTDENTGYKARKELISLSKPVHFNVPLLIDFLSINKLFPNCKSIVFTLHKQRPEFLLHAPDATKQYKIKFIRLELKTDKVTLHPNLYQSNEINWLTRNMRFNFDRCKMLEYSIKQGQTLVDFNEIISGEIPKYFIMFMVKTAAITGVITDNPWQFPTNGLTKLYCKINGHIMPSYPYEFGFAQTPPDCLTGFAALYDDLGINRAAKEHYVTMDQYTGGAFLVPFSFCSDLCFGRNTHEPTTGQISIHMQFSASLTTAYTLMLFAVYDDEFQIDASRQITFPRNSKLIV